MMVVVGGSDLRWVGEVRRRVVILGFRFEEDEPVLGEERRERLPERVRPLASMLLLPVPPAFKRGGKSFLLHVGCGRREACDSQLGLPVKR